MRKTVIICSSGSMEYKGLLKDLLPLRDQKLDFFVSMGGGSIYYSGLMCQLLDNYRSDDSVVSCEHLCSAGIFYTQFVDFLDYRDLRYSFHPIRFGSKSNNFLIGKRTMFDYQKEVMIEDFNSLLLGSVRDNVIRIYNMLFDFSVLCYDYMETLNLGNETIEYLLGEYARSTVDEFFSMTAEQKFLRFKIVIDRVHKVFLESGMN